jgi:hypothetical protein
MRPIREASDDLTQSRSKKLEAEIPSCVLEVFSTAESSPPMSVLRSLAAPCFALERAKTNGYLLRAQTPQLLDRHTVYSCARYQTDAKSCTLFEGSIVFPHILASAFVVYAPRLQVSHRRRRRLTKAGHNEEEVPSPVPHELVRLEKKGGRR